MNSLFQYYSWVYYNFNRDQEKRFIFILTA